MRARVRARIALTRGEVASGLEIARSVMPFELFAESNIGQALLMGLDLVYLLEVAKLAASLATPQTVPLAEPAYLLIARAFTRQILMQEMIVFAPVAKANGALSMPASHLLSSNAKVRCTAAK